jgi:rubrerythrin
MNSSSRAPVRLETGAVAALVDEFLDTADSANWNRFRDLDWVGFRPELLTDAQRSAVRFITTIEDHLPGYFAEYHRYFPTDPGVPADAFAFNREVYRFTVRWAQEEDRHAHALFLYQVRSGLCGADELRAGLAEEGRKPFRLDLREPVQMFAYTLVQEKATQLFYQQFARAVSEPVLKALLNRLARDEARHFAFLARVVEGYVERFGEAVVAPMQEVLQTFKMPLADTLRNYWRWSLVVAEAAGGFDHTEAYESLVEAVTRAADSGTRARAADLAAFVRRLRCTGEKP